MYRKNKAFVLASRPFGVATTDNFRLVETVMPVIEEKKVLIKSKYISVDPYMRGRMNEGRSYVAPYKLNEPITGDIIGEVVESALPAFKKGDMVHGELNWQLYNLADASEITLLDTTITPLSAYLGVLGLTGLTAYFGLIETGKPSKGETVVISGAAGAVGTAAGQIAKIKGCKVMGITGSNDKVNFLKQEAGFDDAVNYKEAKNLRKALNQLCPGGIDIYFDNVGGEISDSVTYLTNDFARIIVCGQISQLNQSRMPVGPRLQGIVLVRRLLIKGFIVSDYKEQFGEASVLLKKWFTEGRLMHKETIIEGFEKLPEAFMGLFRGDNTGKMIVKVD
ncbi:MAG: NADP-dependent oxidoreductase [Bacteroidales bacterium]|nr:NADP-dependent oxidoreductase [Bacteroidales bacterium]